MRALIIDDGTRAKVRAVLEFAAGNLYRPGQSETVPGDDPRHTVLLNTFRCVFSLTEMHGRLFRHLSVSIPSEKFPNPFVVYTIAELFGFTGWDGQSGEPPEDWMLNVNRQEHCITLAQQIK